MHRGVYLVGPVAGPYAAEMAAVAACGGDAVVSHESAGALWGQVSPRHRPALPHVIATKGGRRRSGIQVYRIATLLRDEATQFEQIPITTPARTLIDLAGSLGGHDLEKALAETFARGLGAPDDVRRLLSRHPRSPGAGVLRSLLDSGGAVRTRSEAEKRFIEMARQAGFKPPQVNVVVEGFEVDFFWPAADLIVEIDGYAFHATRSAFERDHRRDARLTDAGYRVRRFTWRQITRESHAVVTAVAVALAGAGAGRSHMNGSDAHGDA